MPRVCNVGELLLVVQEQSVSKWQTHPGCETRHKIAGRTDCRPVGSVKVVCVQVKFLVLGYEFAGCVGDRLAPAATTLHIASISAHNMSALHTATPCTKCGVQIQESGKVNLRKRQSGRLSKSRGIPFVLGNAQHDLNSLVEENRSFLSRPEISRKSLLSSRGTKQKKKGQQLPWYLFRFSTQSFGGLSSYCSWGQEKEGESKKGYRLAPGSS